MTIAEEVEKYLENQRKVSADGSEDRSIKTGDFLATLYKEDALVRVSRVAIAAGEHYGFKRVAIVGNELTIETRQNQTRPQLIELLVPDQSYEVVSRLLGEEEVLRKRKDPRQKITFFDIPNENRTASYMIKFADHGDTYLHVAGIEESLKVEYVTLTLGEFESQIKQGNVHVLNPQGRLIEQELGLQFA